MKPPFTHISVASVICVAVLAVYGMWYNTISTKSAAVVALQNTIDTKNETASRIAAARATLAGIANDEQTVRGYFVAETDIVSFINSLEALGKVLGATVNVLSVSTAGTTSRPVLSLTLSVAGSFDAVMRTVGAIEYAPYDLSIAKLAVVQDDKNSWHADMTILVGSVPTVRTATSTSAMSPAAPVSFAPYHAYF